MRDCVNLTLQNGPDVPGHSWIRFQVMNKDVISCDDLIGKVASHLVPFFLFPSGKPQAVKGKRIVGSVEKADARGPKRRRDPPELVTDHCNLCPLRRPGPREHGHDKLKAFMDEKKDIKRWVSASSWRRSAKTLETQRISTSWLRSSRSSRRCSRIRRRRIDISPALMYSIFRFVKKTKIGGILQQMKDYWIQKTLQEFWNCAR